MLRHRVRCVWPLALIAVCACSDSPKAEQAPVAEKQEAGNAAPPARNESGGAPGSTTPSDAGAAPANNRDASTTVPTMTTPQGGTGTSAAGQGGTPQASAGQPAMEPPKLPDGAVSQPGKYSGFGDKMYNKYSITSQYVAVRDGTKLAVDLLRPQDASGKVVETPLPVLFMHTPYNRRYFPAGGSGDGTSGESYPGFAARLIPYGYVVAIADFRGVYASYGVNQGYNRGEWVDTAKMDAYDLIEWLAMQPWSTGKVGMWGCSATGGSQMQAITTAPPHLKAIFPMSCEFDVYPFGVPGGMSAGSGDTKAPPSGGSATLRDSQAVPVDGDTGRTQLRAATADHAKGVENPGYVPFRDSTAANIPEKWWIKSSPSTYLDMINASGIAVYAAANWDENATKYGAPFIFNNLTVPRKLIIGPSTHCAWSMVQSMTGFDIAVEEHRFFDHWLKGVENNVMYEDKVYYWTYNEPDNKGWRSAPSWPLPNEKRTQYYLGAKTLNPAAPTEADAKDEARVDYGTTATNVSGGLVYETAELAKDVRVTGHPLIDLWISSTATPGARS